MLKENKREEITKNIEKREALVEQVADGIWRIGVELPQNPLRELNSYLIKGKENERDLLIDTGFRREECREALFAGLRALGSSPDRLDILLTHLHSDHTGLAREAAGADSRIYISGIDLTILKDGFTPERPLRLAAQFRAGGFPEDEMKKTQALNPAVRYKLD
ncbi:MAG: MBL fold metallo-hydrolase, partial [Clostridium fessum]